MASKVRADQLQKLSTTHKEVSGSIKTKTSRANATASKLKLETSRNPAVKQVPARAHSVSQRVAVRSATIEKRSDELARRSTYVAEQSAKQSTIKAPTKALAMPKTSASANTMHRSATKLGAQNRARPSAPIGAKPVPRPTPSKPALKLRSPVGPRPKPIVNGRKVDIGATLDLAKAVVDFPKHVIESATRNRTAPPTRQARRAPLRSPRAKAPSAPVRPSGGQAGAPLRKRTRPGSPPRKRVPVPKPTPRLAYKPKVYTAYSKVFGQAPRLATPLKALTRAGGALGALDLAFTATDQYAKSRSQGRTTAQATRDAALRTGYTATGSFVGGRVGGAVGFAVCSPIPPLAPFCAAAGTVAGSYYGGKAGEAAYARYGAPRPKPAPRVVARRR